MGYSLAGGNYNRGGKKKNKTMYHFVTVDEKEKIV